MGKLTKLRFKEGIIAKWNAVQNAPPKRNANPVHAKAERQRRNDLAFNAMLDEFMPQKQANDNAVQGRHSPFDSKHTFGNWLVKKGFCCIGSGSFSSVYWKKGDRVIKVGCEDDWIEYIQWGHKQGFGGKYVPRVFSYKSFPGKTMKDNWSGEDYKQPFYVAVMEKLEFTARQLFKKDKAHDLLVATPLFEAAVEYNNPMASTLLDLLIPGIGFFKDKFANEFQDARLDLHQGNFMLRSDGSFVLTDPITSVKDGTRSGVKRLRLTDLSPANDNYKEVRLVA